MKTICLYDLTLSPDYELKPLTEYLVENQSVAYHASRVDGNIRVTGGIPDTFCAEVAYGKNDKILLFRSGGAGDILFCFPLFAAIKSKFPLTHLAVACDKSFHFILESCPYVDEILEFPIQPNRTEGYFTLNLEGAVEEQTSLHIVECFYKKAGIPISPSFQIKQFLKYQPKDEDIQAALSECPASGRKRIAYQWEASSPVRSYPNANNCVVVTHLLQKGHDVFLMGRPDSISLESQPPKSGGQLVNLTKGKLTWAQSVALMKTCDLVIGPDSSGIHFAGAMGVKALGLYGSFRWKTRTSYFDSVYCLQADGPCAPCYHHSTNKNGIFPKGEACDKKRECVVLGSLPPERVISKALQML